MEVQAMMVATMELVWILERTHEDSHLSDETRETRQTKVGQTGNDIAHCEERHNLHQAVQIADVTSVGTTIDHTDEGKEQCCHQTMRQHLQNSTCARGLCHHQQGKENQSAV